MEIKFIAQPFDDYDTLSKILIDKINNEDMEEIIIVVAWVKKSGLDILSKPITSFKMNGGHSSLITGIDFGLTTKDGLELAHEIFDDVFIFHDLSNRTFHPKAYILFNKITSFVIIGSNNLTNGGINNNFETSLLITINRNIAEEDIFFNKIIAWVNLLKSDYNSCKKMNDDILNEILTNKIYNINSEIKNFNINKSNTIFGRSIITKKRSIRRKPSIAKKKGHIITESVIISQWSKLLSKSDAQQVGSNTNPTGSLKLSKGLNETAIDFRNDFFINANWTQEIKKDRIKEFAIIEFNVTIDNVSHGLINLMVDFGLHRIANQNNVSTWLHWGSLQTIIRSNNYKDCLITINKYDNGTYSLSIEKQE